MRNYLSKWEQDYYFHQKERFMQIVQLIKKYCDNTRNDEIKLLDIGCGSGILTEMIKQLNLNFVIFGIDADQVHIKLANIRGVPSILCDAIEMPFKDKIFDFILCSEVIEHLEYPSKLLAEIMRLLKSKGLLLLTTPNRLRWKKRIEEIIRFLSENYIFNKLMRFLMGSFYDFDLRAREKREKTINPPWGDKKFHTHKREYSLNEFCKTLMKYDFKVLEIKTASETSHYPLISLINSILSRKQFLDDFIIAVTTPVYP